MTTATYQGRRVYVLGEAFTAIRINGKLHFRDSDEKQFIIRESDSKSFGDFIVSESELSEYEEAETA